MTSATTPAGSKKFWLENPCKLFTSLNLFPNTTMTKPEKLNSLTRLALVLGGIMYAMKYEHAITFVVLAVLLIVVLNYSGDDGFERGKSDSQTKLTEDGDKVGREDFTMVPTYLGTDFQQTIVAPTFAEEWQIPPPAYDLYTQVPYPGPSKDTFQTPMQPQSYPYGQYLTRTNLLPSDEYYTHLGCGGARTAREYANSTFLRHSLAHQDNMTRIIKKKLNRRFRQNSQDTISPYSSY